MKPAARLTTNIVGGLGNQLFLLANLLATSRRNSIPAFVEPVALSSSAEAPRPTYWSSIFRELDQHGVQLTSPLSPLALSSPPSSLSSPAPSPVLPVVDVPEMRPVRKIELNAQRACVYNMVGFFQCEEFFNDYPVLRAAIPADLWRTAQELLRRHYQADDCHTIALHMRRGDYTRFRDIFEQLEVNYYDAAVRQLCGGLLLHQRNNNNNNDDRNSHQKQQMCTSSPLLHLLIFSDELRAAQTMAGYFRVKYKGLRVSVVNAEIEQAEEQSANAMSHALHAATQNTPREVLELLMMAQCSDVVMANSTFSWWGAYLNRVPLRRVIAPSKWFVKDPYPASNHLYCPGWMLI